MSTIIALKDAGTLVLGTDSRVMAHDHSGVASDTQQKIFEIAPKGTFIAMSGRTLVSDFQVARARKLAIELGTSDIQAIGAALVRESLPCLTGLVDRLRLEYDEITRQALTGEVPLHACIIAGRTAGGQLGYVYLSFRVQAGWSIECVTEAYFEARRKITATSGAPLPIFTDIMAQCAQDMATWIDPPERVVVRLLEVMRRSAPVIGGPDQVVCLDKKGAHWIHRPAALTGDSQITGVSASKLTVGTLVAGVSITSPIIIGGSLSITTSTSATVQIGPTVSGVRLSFGAYVADLDAASLTINNGSTGVAFGPNAGLVFGINTCVNTSGVWVGPGVNCPSYAVTCASVTASGAVTCASVTASGTIRANTGFNLNGVDINSGVVTNAWNAAVIAPTWVGWIPAFSSTGTYLGKVLYC